MITQPTKSNLDDTIYLHFACYSCGTIQYIPLDDVLFCTDIDLVQTEGRYVDAWIETDCEACGQHLERTLGREELDTDNS